MRKKFLLLPLVVSMLAGLVVALFVLFYVYAPESSLQVVLVNARSAGAPPAVAPLPLVSVSSAPKIIGVAPRQEIAPAKIVEVAPVPSAGTKVFKCKENGHTTYSSVPCAAGAVVADYDAGRASTLGGAARTATILSGANGGYYVRGSVEGHPLDFMIDTGATKTSLPGEYLSRLGVRRCERIGVSSTANGNVRVCVAYVSRLTVAGFDFSDVLVTFMPNMTGFALFGQDLLSQFSVTQQNGVMTISR